MPRRSGPGGPGASVKVDAQGRFRLDGLPPGPYTLDAGAQGYAQPPYRRSFWGYRFLEVRAGETVERTLRLTPQ